MSEEQETFRRARLDDTEDEGDNDDESEEEVGSNQYRNRMDDDEEEEEEEDINEATDDELWSEIADEKKLIEERDREIELLKQELIQNGSLSENDTFNINNYFNDSRFDRFRNIGQKGENVYQMPGHDLESDPEAQLTTFQENIITTGSSASVVLLILLVVLFVVQFVRKVYEHFRKERIENSIGSVLTEAEGERAEDQTLKPTAYAVYNTPFDERILYEEKERQGADLNTLQQILEKRAIRVILRGTKIQEDGPGIRKNWQLDMVPRDVWDDFSAAEVNVKKEFESIIAENNEKQFYWGPKYEHNILQYAKEKIQYKRQQQIMHMRKNAQMGGNPAMQRPGPKPGVRASEMLNNPNRPSSNNPPSARNFGKGIKGGFLNQSKQKQNPKEKLTRRQKKKLKQQQQGGEGGDAPQQQAPGDASVYNPGGNDFQPQSAQTMPQRRKKGRRKFK